MPGKGCRSHNARLAPPRKATRAQGAFRGDDMVGKYAQSFAYRSQSGDQKELASTR
jgi:hypothetical protein